MIEFRLVQILNIVYVQVTQLSVERIEKKTRAVAEYDLIPPPALWQKKAFFLKKKSLS